MNAAEYLSTIQARLQPELFEKADLENTTNQVLRSRDRILAMLTEREKGKLPDLAFGVLPTFDPNAWAIPVPGEQGVVICIDMLLPTCLWTVSRALGQALRESAEPNKYHDPITNVVRPLGLTAAWFLTRNPRYALQLQVWKENLEPLPHPFDVFAAAFIVQQLDFIIMHEIQHVLRGHTGNIRRGCLSSTSAEDAAIGVSRYSQSIQQEFEADREATVTLCRDEQSKEVGAFAACEILFLFLQSVELVSPKQARETTHPSALQRLSAVRSTYDNLSGGMKGFGIGLQRVTSDMFQIQQEMFSDFPMELWLNAGGMEGAAREYARRVLNGVMATHVTVGGYITEHESNAISSNANNWLQQELVHSGSTRKSNTLLPEMGMVGGFIGGLAALALFLTQLYQFRKRERELNRWSSDRMKELVNEELNRRRIDNCACSSVSHFDKSVVENGELCEIELRDFTDGSELLVRVSVLSAGVSLWIKRERPLR